MDNYKNIRAYCALTELVDKFEFEPFKLGCGMYGPGMYFYGDENSAKECIKTGYLYEVRLNFDNPFVCGDDIKRAELLDIVKSEYVLGEFVCDMNTFKIRGYDSVISIDEVVEDEFDNGTLRNQYVAFRPEQIEIVNTTRLAEQENITALTESYITINMRQLFEDTRLQFLNKSKTADLYVKERDGHKNRQDRKAKSSIIDSTASYKDTNMNDFFKTDELKINIPINGESNNYTVTIMMTGVLEEIRKIVKSNNNKFEYATVLQALTNRYNNSQIKVACDCSDFKYRYKHNLIASGNSTFGTADDPGPGKTGMTARMKGQGCKHILHALDNTSWILKVSQIIYNYILYLEEKMSKPFLNIIFPKIWGVVADDMVDRNIIDDDKYLKNSKGLIKAIQNYSRLRKTMKKKDEDENTQK